MHLQVSKEQRRPEFPKDTPQRFRQLAEWCWNRDAQVRPTFEEVLNTLLQIRKDEAGPTPQLANLALHHQQQNQRQQHSRQMQSAALHGAANQQGGIDPGNASMCPRQISLPRLSVAVVAAADNGASMTHQGNAPLPMVVSVH